MSWLKIYDWERSAYPEFYKVEVGRSDAPRYFRKFARHFKVSEPRLSNHIKRNGGSYYSSFQNIRLPHTTNLGTVIHEFAHHLTYKTDYKKHGHDKQFKRCLKKAYTFAKRYLPKEGDAGKPSNPLN